MAEHNHFRNRYTVYASIFAILVPLSLAASSASAHPSTNAAIAAIRIVNFGTVNDQYYRGAQPEGHDYVDLAKLGVKTVIDLTEDGRADEAGMVQQAGMTFYRIPLTTHDRPSEAAIAQFLSLVTDKANLPVYVHCQGGHHRTGVMTAVYRMTQDGWSADRAYGEMQKYGFGPAFLHSTLKEFVFDYYNHMDRQPANALLTAAATTTPATPHEVAASAGAHAGQ